MAVPVVGDDVPLAEPLFAAGLVADLTTLLPAYLARNFATSIFSGPVTMFSGMIAPEKPPFSIANSMSGIFSMRVSKFGPSTFSLSVTFVAEPCVPAALSVWHAPQCETNSTAPVWFGSVAETLMACEPQPAVRSAAAARHAAVRMRGAMGGADHTEQWVGRMRTHRLTIAVLVASATALGGCGDGKLYKTDRPILRISLDEYRIVPQNIQARPGRIKIVVRNVGKLTHNLVIQYPAKHPGDNPIEVPGGRVKSMQPGEVAEPIKITLKPGTYRLVCTIANHDDLGQYGKLVIKGPPL